jgi:hypothetical protein
MDEGLIVKEVGGQGSECWLVLSGRFGEGIGGRGI